MKKIISIILFFTLVATFSACSSENNATKEAMVTDNIVYWDNVNYKVNPVLNSEENIDYVDVSEKNGVTCAEFGWNSFSNEDGEGNKDILFMYYDNSKSDVQNGKQTILGSAYCHYNDSQQTEWSYLDAEDNLIYQTVDNKIYDKNSNEIGYIGEDGCYDNENKPLDVSSFDPFIEIFNEFRNSSETSSVETETEDKNEEDIEIEYSELALSQQKVVGFGKEKNGIKYEVVANIDETYQGSKLMIGVIKNGKWLIEPNNDCPFINDNYIKYQSEWRRNGEDIDKIDCTYLKNGVFCNTKDIDIASNVNFGKYLSLWDVENNKHLYYEDISNYFILDYVKLGDNKNDNFVFVQTFTHGMNERSKIYFLDTATFDVKEISEVISRNSVICYQIKDGLFYSSADLENGNNIGTFYDVDCNKQFDLSEFDTEETQIISVGYFEDGKCKIINELDNGSKYKIIIDKTGKVLSSEKISYEN